MSQAIKLYRKYPTILKKSGFVTAERLACFFGQAIAEVEESLKPLDESGYYTSIERLRNIFVTPFRGKSDFFVKGYLRSSKKLLSYVYANRMGNGSESSGDGYKYRGRGVFQITGKNNYAKLSLETGIDFIGNPDLLLDEANSLIAAIWYWNSRNLSKYADAMNIDAISDLINIGRLTSTVGDAHNYRVRQGKTNELLELFKKELEIKK